MGTEDPEAWASDAEGPVRPVDLKPFALDLTAVTNGQFAAFVDATGYRTEAEHFGWSYVFLLQLPKGKRKKGHYFGRSSQCDWWIGVNGARWNQPAGPGSDLGGLADHPVVHISWNDASAYAQWVGKRLPTEAEWEYAARGGLEQKKYPWGDDLHPDHRHACNIWQGVFPEKNTAEDGHLWTAPVRSFQPNGYGLHQMSGNVWEWCSDWWGTQWSEGIATNPAGPAQGANKVIRGGSFLCHKSYCNRYRVAARSSNTPDSAASHTGFRCAADLP
jgi:formylglycine-generating enzyme required for sulfatase activity